MCIKLCFAEWCHPQNSRDPAGRGTRSKKIPGRSQKFTSFFLNILPSHPGLAKEHLMLLFPQLFHQKPGIRLSGTFVFPLFGAAVKFPETKRICKCFFFQGRLERQVLQGGNSAMAACGVTALNWNKTRSLDGHMPLEELCWTMLNIQAVFPIQIFTIGSVWISFSTFPSREKSKAQVVGEQSPLLFIAEVG